VEEALTKFEPRLKSVQVSLESPRKFDAALHFRIDALLRLDPAPEPVTFDAALQLGTSSYSVRGEGIVQETLLEYYERELSVLPAIGARIRSGVSQGGGPASARAQ
jgi:hypothetical protein